MNVLRPYFTKEQIKNIQKEVGNILASGWIGMGPKVQELEEKWAEFTGAKYAVATNSCTSALDVAVRLVKLPNPVKVSAFTFVSSALSPLNAGYDIELVDIDENSLCTPKSDIQVMYAGNQFGEGIIYDMAHSGGAKHKGLISCWSFHAVKNLPMGDGGMITMNDKK
jgi:perosamine synthetase